jgi:virulence-associated protein VagC
VFAFKILKLKKIVILFFVLFYALGCSKPSECIESTGDRITREFSVTAFDKIIIYSGISLVITQGPVASVQVQTGENLISNIEVKVENGVLSVKDKTTCNWVRDYGNTTVFVTSPNLTEIHSKTEKNIASNGPLTYPILSLISTDLSDGAGTGDFYLNINNSQLVVENNNVSRYFISGSTNKLKVNFYEGNGRFMGDNFNAKEVEIFHRGTNDIVVKPIEKVTGKLYSTGNLILKNTPSIVDVQQYYQGRVIYN